MKKKFVVALVAAMSLTVAGTGTVFAMDKVSTIASEKEHVHGDNCEWVVDKEAWDETVHHDAVTEKQWVVDKEAWTETIEHPAETEEQWVVDKEAWTEEVLKYKCVCNGCQAEFATDDEWMVHSKENAMNGDLNHMGYTNVPYYETVKHPEEGHYETVVIKPAWTETVNHPEEGHYEDVVIKEAWDEIVHHEEEGHWVCNGEPQEPEQKPENPDQKPEQPENPEQKPEQPENPDQKPEQPENPETPEQKPEANKENVQTQETETKKEGTSPKTGDTTSALPVAGAGLASLGVVLATILKKRK